MSAFPLAIPWALSAVGAAQMAATMPSAEEDWAVRICPTAEEEARALAPGPPPVQGKSEI